MASISTNKKTGLRTLQFMGIEGKRRTIYLGKMPKKNAESLKLRVEMLVSAKLSGHAVDDETARWVANLPAPLTEKLAKVGLVPERALKPTLAQFLSEYVARRIDVKSSTKEVWGQVTRNLRGFFDEHRDPATITEGDAEDFKMYLVQQKLASTTVHKRLQFARQFFKAAMKRKLVKINPFAEVTAVAVMRSDRQRFIEMEEFERLIDACSPEWRVIVALSRLGGLRCPSETLSLRWQDVDWGRDRIEVQSPKTEHHPGRGSRTIPLFAELRPILEEAFELAPEGAVYVVNNDRLRKASQGRNGWRNANLRTQFKRIIERVGLEPWPRLFHALRASRETELAKTYPLHVVTAWLGNTPKIALKHYLQTTQADFDRAARCDAPSTGQTLQKPVQQPSAQSRRTTQPPDTSGGCADSCEMVPELAGTMSGEDRIRTCGRT